MYFVFVSLVLVLPMTVNVVFAENSSSVIKKPRIKSSIQKSQSGDRLAKATSNKTKSKSRSVARSAGVVASDDVELQKALDLSLSLGDVETTTLNEMQNRANQPGPISIFAAKKKPQRSLSLDGQLLMSQEPEADKTKSMEGAGISINLKR